MRSLMQGIFHHRLALLLLPLLVGGCAIGQGGREPSAMATSTPDAAAFIPAWMEQSAYRPIFHVLDTESSLGPYAAQPKTVTMADLVKMHGHPCDGLVTAACALSVGLERLYPGGVIDRTDTGCITNNSPCFGDVAAYLTGGRIRFGTQKIDPALKNEFILYRFSTGQAVKVALRPGRFPANVLALEQKLRAGGATLEEIRLCQRLEWDYARSLLQHPLAESFTVQDLKGFTWQPDRYEHLGKRGDTLYKDAFKRASK